MNANVFFSVTGTVTSIINNVTPALAILDRVKTKTLHQVSFNNLLVNHLGQMMWLYYGFRVWLMGIIAANVFTASLSFINLFLYVYHTGIFMRFSPIYVAAFAVGTAVAWMVLTPEVLGLACMILTILTSISTLEFIKNAVTHSDFRYVDLRMACSMLFCGINWTLYGIVNNDFASYTSNGFSAGLAVILLLTHFYYRTFKLKST